MREIDKLKLERESIPSLEDWIKFEKFIIDSFTTMKKDNDLLYLYYELRKFSDFFEKLEGTLRISDDIENGCLVDKLIHT